MNIFVGCASRLPQNIEFIELAKDIGYYISSGKHNLVFGGYDGGLMGKVCSIVNKSKTSDIIIATCEAYKEEVENNALANKKIYVAKTVCERKDMFFKLADVLVFLPGGIGTIDELSSAIEAKRCGEHNLPIIIINQDGFFDYYLSMLNKIYADGFADSKSRKLYIVVNDFSEAFGPLETIALLNKNK